MFQTGFFPEMAALVLGLWVIDKKIWTVSRPMLVLLMTSCAFFGVLLVCYSPFPILVNIAISFAFTSLCLIMTRTTLIPITSAAMLPVLLGTHSLVYPVSVFIMSLLVVSGQFAIPVSIGMVYFIVPPLVVMFIEFSSSSAGFRNRPLQVYLVMLISATLGVLFQHYLHTTLNFPQAYTVSLLFLCLFLFYEIVGKPFAPACAIALVPMIIPQKNVLSYPFQVAIGSGVFLFVAMFFFQKCYRWKRTHLLVCFIPEFIRCRMERPKRKEREIE